MAKSKGNYHKKKRRSQKSNQIKQVQMTNNNSNNKNLEKPKENKNVYTQEYLDYKHQQETSKPLILRIFVIALACVILLGFIIAPLF